MIEVRKTDDNVAPGHLFIPQFACLQDQIVQPGIAPVW